MGDKARGIYKKYLVYRVDGTDGAEGKHAKCKLFVLDATHDPHAIPALNAYADSCERDYPPLAGDIRDMIVEAGGELSILSTPIPRPSALDYWAKCGCGADLCMVSTGKEQKLPKFCSGCGKVIVWVG